MKTKLNRSECDLVLAGVRSVLDTGETWDAKELHHPAGPIINAVLTIPGMKKKEDEESGNGEGFDTNGWQYDWWQTFVYKGKSYTLSGSGYHGGHRFNIADE